VGALSHAAPAYTPTTDSGATSWADVSTSQRVDHILDPIIWNGFTWAVVGAAVAVWLTIRLRGAYAVLGSLIVGGLWGAVAGVAGTAVYAIPRHLMNPGGKPSNDHHDLLLVLGVAVTGAIAGAVVGWFWGRRGSAGLVVGLLAGALWEEIVIGAGWSGTNDQVAKACLGAAVIVGLTALTQALLDAMAERSPRALATSRGP
jgi:hypothetical protein